MYGIRRLAVSYPWQRYTGIVKRESSLTEINYDVVSLSNKVGSLTRV